MLKKKSKLDKEGNMISRTGLNQSFLLGKLVVLEAGKFFVMQDNSVRSRTCSIYNPKGLNVNIIS